jgi:hypothetical protein
MTPRPRRGGGHRAEDMRPGMFVPLVRPDIDDPRAGRVPPGRRPGPRHAAPTPPPTPRTPRAPVSAVPVTPVMPYSPAGGMATRRAATRERGRAYETGRDLTYLAAMRAGSGRPSTVGRAAGGAVAGGTAGAALAGPVGAGVGGAAGGIGGAVSGARAKRAYKAAMRTHPIARKMIVAEFTICMIVIALSPLTDKRKQESGRAFMRRMTALMALFILLGIVSAGGDSAAKLAAAFGGLVMVVLLVSERDLAAVVGALFAQRGGPQPTGPGPGEEPDPVFPPGYTGGY